MSSGFAILSEQALLVLAVVCTRPATVATTRLRLLGQGALLCVCLLSRLFAGGGVLPAACLAVTLIEVGLVYVRAGRWREDSTPQPFWPIAAAVLAVWLAFRLLPAQSVVAQSLAAQAPTVQALPAIALGIVLCGLVGLLASGSDRARWAALLTAGHGVLLLVGTVPGPGWPGLLMALPLQAFALLLFCARPVWSDQVGMDRA